MWSHFVEYVWEEILSSTTKYNKLCELLKIFRETHPTFYLFSSCCPDKEHNEFVKFVLESFSLPSSFKVLKGFTFTKFMFQIEYYENLGTLIKIPLEIIECIFSWCNKEDLINFQRVSKAFNILSNTDSVWKRKINNHNCLSYIEEGMTKKMEYVLSECFEKMLDVVCSLDKSDSSDGNIKDDVEVIIEDSDVEENIGV